MIGCKNCGAQNDLGRVFCTKCGSKLDLSNITNEAVADAVRVGFMRKHWWKFAVGIVVIILGINGLTFWPTKVIAPEKGTLVGARRIESYLKGMENSKKGVTLAYELREADINGYFEHGRGKDLGLGTVRVKCTPGVMHVQIMDTMFNLKLGPVIWSPTTSYDIYCTGVGPTLFVGKAKKGRLTMMGPGKSGLVRRFYRTLAAKNAFAPFKYVTDIQIDEGRIRLTVSNK